MCYGIADVIPAACPSLHLPARHAVRWRMCPRCVRCCMLWPCCTACPTVCLVTFPMMNSCLPLCVLHTFARTAMRSKALSPFGYQQDIVETPPVGVFGAVVRQLMTHHITAPAQHRLWCSAAGWSCSGCMQEFCNGGSLRGVLHRGGFNHANMHHRWRSVRRALRGLAAGMAYTHAKRVCHGDLNPSNILLKVRRCPACLRRAAAATCGIESATSVRAQL